MAPPKKYPDDLKARAVRLYRESDPKPAIRKLAEQLGVHHEALRNWIRQDQADRGECRRGRRPAGTGLRRPCGCLPRPAVAPGQPWRPGTPPPTPLAPDTPSADIRIGYARCSTLTQELQSHLDALAGHGIDPDKVFSEKISTRVRVRPKFEQALALADRSRPAPRTAGSS